MHQSLRAESSDRSPESETLHPVLRSALTSLDIRLEEELSRYRRQKAGAQQGYRYTSRKLFSKPIDLLTVAPAKKDPETLHTALDLTPELEEKASASVDEVSKTMTQMQSGSTPLPTESCSPSPAPKSSLPSSDLGADWDIVGQPPQNPPSSSPQLNPVDEPFLTNGGGTSELATMMHAMPGLEDYLESSEELLRSLAEEEAEIQAEQGFMQNLVTPLGIGSMLLLLLSSAMFGYVVMNPSTLTRLLTARTVSSTQVPLKSSGPSESTGEIASAPNPNLAAQEFKQLNLNTLGTVKTNQNPASGISTSPTASPTPTSSPTPLSTRLGASGNSTTTPILSPPQLQPSSPMPIVEAPVRSPQNYPPVQPANSYPPPVVAPPSSRSSYTPPATPYRSPAQEPSLPTTTPAPPVSPAPPNNNSSSEASYPYKIVTHYANDHSLEAARKAVPDAFVPNFPDAGAKIQLGAYQDANSAEARVQELRRQGIAAEVYKP